MERYTMKDFMEKKIAVTFANADEQKRFLQECEKAGLMTCSGVKPLEWAGSTHPIYRTPGGYLVKMFVGVDDQTKIPFSAFDFAQPRHEIHITSDGLTTHAVYKLDGKVIKRTKAVCSPKDAYDFLTGAEMAFKRLQQAEKPKKAEKPAPAPWKPAVGDLVYMTRDCEGYKKDDITKISSICGPCHKPKSHNPAGREVHLPAGSYLPVREVDRPAKAGEWVRLKIDVYEHAKAGDLLKIDIYSGVACVKGKNHPRQTFQGTRPDPEYAWVYCANWYVVLEPDSPEVPHA